MPAAIAKTNPNIRVDTESLDSTRGAKFESDSDSFDPCAMMSMEWITEMIMSAIYWLIYRNQILSFIISSP